MLLQTAWLYLAVCIKATQGQFKPHGINSLIVDPNASADGSSVFLISAAGAEISPYPRGPCPEDPAINMNRK